MFTNNLVRIVTGITGIILIPVVPLSTFLLGLLVSISFGLVLYPICLLWSICFYFPLLGLSYVYENFKICKPLAAAIGVPFAVIGEVYVSLMPSGEDTDCKMARSLSANSFPFTYSITHFNNPEKFNSLLKKERHYEIVLYILNREKIGNPSMAAYIDKYLLHK